MNKHIKALIKLSTDNPDLPIIPIVENEVVYDTFQDCSWLGKFSYCSIGEYAQYGEGYIIDDRQYLEEVYGEDHEELSEQEVSKICEKMSHKAILVWIAAFSGIQEEK